MKKGKVFSGLLGMFLITLLSLTGCSQPTDGDSTGSSTPTGTDATLSSVTVAGVTANPGVPANPWADSVVGYVVLPDELLTGAVVTAVPSDSRASIAYGHSTPPGTPVLSADVTTYDLAEGDIITVRVTSGDRSGRLYYKIAVATPNTTSVLTGLAINEKAVTLGSAGTDLDSSGVAEVLLTRAEAGAPAIVPAKAYFGETVRYAKAADNAEPVWSIVPPAAFNDNDVLLIKVTSSNGENDSYYKVRIYLAREATIVYGQPTIGDTTVDEVWDTAGGWLPIERVYSAGSTADFRSSPDTSGRAKVLWDEAGLYVLIEVTDPVITSGTATNNYSSYDSVEIYIDQAPGISNGSGAGTGTGQYGYSNKGGLYRIDVSNVRSGDPTAATTALTTLDKTSVWTGDSGYYIEAQVPFRNIGNSLTAGTALPAGTVPAPDNNRVIGLDLQINACIGTGGNTTLGNENGRQGVVVWNNSLTTNNQDTRGYALGTLSGRPVRVDPALTSITVGGKTADLGTPAPVYSNAAAGTGLVIGTTAAAGEVAIAVVKSESHTTLQYAFVPGDSGAPVFGDTASFSNVTDGAIYIKATAEDGVTVLVYKVSIVVVSDAKDLTAFSLGGVSPGAIGAPGASFNAAGYAAANQLIRLTNATDLVNPAVSSTASPGAVVKYGQSAASNTAPTVWETDFSAVTLTSGNYIGIQVSAPDGSVQYYKFRVAAGSTDATLGSITISGRPASLGTPAATFGNSITNGTVSLTSAQVAAGGANRVVAVPTNPTASMRYAVGTSDTGTPSYASTPQTTAYTSQSRITVEVTAEDKITVLIYRVRVTTASSAALTTTGTIGGVTFNAAAQGTPSGEWNDARLAPGSLTLTTAQATNAVLTLAASSGNTSTTKETALVLAADAAQAPSDWATTTDTPTRTFADGDILYIRLTNGAYVNYYKTVIAVGPSTDATTSGISIGDTAAVLGTPGNSWDDGDLAAGSITLTTAELASPGTITVNKEANAAAEYAVVSDDNEPTTFSSTEPASFNDQDRFWVKISAEDGVTVKYYKIVVTEDAS
jgi:hypothetical protein